MAISIDSTTNLNLIDAAEATTGWSWSGITKTATSTNSREGTNSVGGQVPLNSYGYGWHTHGSSVNMTTAGNERVYIWVNSAGPGTVAQNGWMVLIGDGTNQRAYTVGGSDDVPFAVKGWYCLMLDTANLPTTYQQVGGSAAPSLTAITQFGFGIYNVVAPSGNALNIFVDVVRYGSGIVVTSTAGDDITFANIATEDFSSATGAAFGIIREIQPGVYGVQGDILLGDTAGNSIDFKDDNAIVIFEDRVRGTGTNTNFQFSGQHSATGTFSLELGIVVGSGDDESGRSGVLFFSANPASQPVDFDFSDSDIEDVFLYGCIFTNLRGGNIKFSADATNGISHHLSGCNFSGCAQVDTGRTVVRNSLFAATGDTAAALLWNSNIDIKKCNFIGHTTGAAIEHDTWNGSESGTVTTANAAGTTLIDSAATFTGNVAVNDIVYNETDGSFGTVISVDSNIQITHTTLSGGTENDWDSSDAYSIATPYVYTDLLFSGNTNDVDNTTSPPNVVAISKSGTSNPSSYPSGDFVVIQGSVLIEFTVQDEDKVVIQNAQTSVFLLDSPFTELMNEDTNASGIASETYTSTTPVDIKWRVRKSETTDDPRYYAQSGTGQISTSGFSLLVTLKVNPFVS